MALQLSVGVRNARLDAIETETGASAVLKIRTGDTTNTVTPTGSVRRGGTMAAYPGGAAIRHVTVAGAAAGMTGGTLTKDGNMAGSLMAWAATAGASTVPQFQELLDDMNGTHPFVLSQNEGIIVENVVVGSATANVVQVLLDLSWAEVAAF